MKENAENQEENTETAGQADDSPFKEGYHENTSAFIFGPLNLSNLRLWSNQSQSWTENPAQ